MVAINQGRRARTMGISWMHKEWAGVSSAATSYCALLRICGWSASIPQIAADGDKNDHRYVDLTTKPLNHRGFVSKEQ